MRLLAGAEIGFVSTHSASLGSLAELLGDRGLRMVMRYAYLSPTYQSAEVGLLDPPVQTPPSTERATKRATRLEGHTTASESGGILDMNWLAVLDDFRNWLGWACGPRNATKIGATQ